MLQIPQNFLNTTVCLLPSYVIGIAGVGFKRFFVRSYAACIYISDDKSLVYGVVYRKNYITSKTLSADVLGV